MRHLLFEASKAFFDYWHDYEAKAKPVGEKRLVKLLRRQNNLCHYCSKELIKYKMKLKKGDHWPHDKATVDHKVPKSKGGMDIFYNVVAACYECNTEKRDIPYESFMVFVSYRRKLKKREKRKEQSKRQYDNFFDSFDELDNLDLDS